MIVTIWKNRKHLCVQFNYFVFVILSENWNTYFLSLKTLYFNSEIYKKNRNFEYHYYLPANPADGNEECAGGATPGTGETPGTAPGGGGRSGYPSP